MHLVERGAIGAGRRVTGRRGVVGLSIVAALSFLQNSFAAKQGNRRKDRNADRKRSPDKGSRGTDRRRRRQRSSGSGADVVRVAKKHEGAKYKWGGASPKGFDCSGFTWFVYKEATGMDITRGVKEQWQFGRSVKRNAWKPGDIVFFKNTFERGLSHNGIYVGGNQFIHAENERTGVVVTSLKSDYYSDHYAGARRLV